MKRNILIAASALAASFALAPFAQAAEESGEVFFALYDDSAASEPATSEIVSAEPAAGEPEQTARDSDQELADLREQIYRDMLHE